MRLCWIFLWIGPLLYGAGGDEEALFLRRIADFWQEGEYQIAKTQIEEFISEYPESPFSDTLSAALGDLFLREKNYSNALKYYAQIQSSEFTQRAFLNRMQCLYELQWHATLADECEAYLNNESNLQVTYFLAIALYHQCINASQQIDHLQQLAQRAKPHFEALSQSELSSETAQAYAHICCILKEHEKAVEIYLDLAKKEPQLEEEMLFQVGLIQSECAKDLALETFDRIAKLGRKKAKEAAYNRMVLAFELGKYEEIAKQELLGEIPEELRGTARLFLGRSLLYLKRYEEAVKELQAYLEEAPPVEPFYAALLSLLDAAYQCGDLISLDKAIEQLAAKDPNHQEMPKALFSRAQVLKRKERFSEAKEQLQGLMDRFPTFPQKAQVLFELAHLDYKEKAWSSCYESSLRFLNIFPKHELAFYIRKYFASSSVEIAKQKPEHRKQLIEDLIALLEQTPPSEEEKQEWQLLLAKTYYELSQYKEAIACLQNQKTANGRLLLSLCYRDVDHDIEQFCKLAEEALSEGADLIDQGQIHSLLYNGYLEIAKGDADLQRAAHHLYQAFEANADLKIENLLWLADYSFANLTEINTPNPNFSSSCTAAQTSSLLKKCIGLIQHTEGALQSHLDPLVCKQAKLYSLLGRVDEAIALLAPLSSPSDEAQLLLAENYVKKGFIEQATALFDAIVDSAGTVRSPLSASASLQGAKLKIATGHPNRTEIATQLKTLIIQKNLEAEPLFLEAALEYIGLMGDNNPEKRLSLLQKTKEDFEQTDSLLSKDYHAARAKNLQKDKLFQNYMKLIDAQILREQAQIDLQNQKDLQAKAKDLLLQIINEPIASALEERTRKLLNDEK